MNQRLIRVIRAIRVQQTEKKSTTISLISRIIYRSFYHIAANESTPLRVIREIRVQKRKISVLQNND